MIKITIEQHTTVKFAAKENMVKKRTPTQITEESTYGNQKRTMHVEEFEIIDVTKEENRRVVLLNQEIADDSKFNLARVITAINNLDLNPNDMLRR